MALIIPKNNADEQTLDATLKIYYDVNDWVENSYLIDHLSSALDDLGKEEVKKEPQSYTKKTQVLAYYGFITWEDVTNAQSRRKITDLGKRFYEARQEGIPSGIFDVIIESLNKCTFGRNVIGCNSDSDLEPPNIFLKSALLLDGINLNEFAYILQRMEFDKVELADAIFDVSLKRKMGQSVNPNDLAAKWKDPKPILALGNWGLFFVNKTNGLNHYYLNKDVISTYSKDLMALRTKNTDTIRFKMNVNDDDMNENKITGRQIIYYGAPGTGKSHIVKNDEKVKEADKKNFVFRTTFHPDSDYSTFVGAYKPTMDDVNAKVIPVVLGDSGTVFNKNEGTYTEERIVYQFVPQVFLQAYIAAWNNQNENVFLIIEEINRGNCAQIFGDLFQLLDRDNKGFSEYSIKADRDLAKYLCGKDENGNDVLTNKDGIKDGKLKLPKNLYIWATMNTSDQSLFPIDSAFKRRWDWKYMKIKKGKDENGDELDWRIEIKDKDENIVKINDKDSLSWWDFISKINVIIASMTTSADKQLGYFFCKADNEGIIDADTFVSKVIFYLWNDVFKDYGFEDASLFQYKAKKGDKEVTKDLTFPDFFDEEGENINEERLKVFLESIMNWKKKDEEQK